MLGSHGRPRTVILTTKPAKCSRGSYAHHDPDLGPGLGMALRTLGSTDTKGSSAYRSASASRRLSAVAPFASLTYMSASMPRLKGIRCGVKLMVIGDPAASARPYRFKEACDQQRGQLQTHRNHVLRISVLACMSNVRHCLCLTFGKALCTCTKTLLRQSERLQHRLTT